MNIVEIDIKRKTNYCPVGSNHCFHVAIASYHIQGISFAIKIIKIANIKIMPCVEGDRSDCQPEASSIARSRRLRAVVVVEG